MKILYISNLTGNLYAGPNHSVPAQIAAQSKYDDVFWINLNDNEITNDKAGLLHKLSEIKGKIPDDLPEPFNKPDLVIFEEFYCYPFNKIIYRVVNQKIPYIIIPRSQMTHQAKEVRKAKKKIADALFFNWFVKKAVAIHYLTETEKNDSAAYKTKSVILPNGIHMPEKVEQKKAEDSFVISYIGRLNIFQKGIDVLMDACGLIKEDLIKNHVKVRFYGPDQEGALEQMEHWRSSKGLETVVEFYGSVFAEQKAEVLRQSDAFIMSSRFEGMPMGLIEALSYGLPCIVTPGTNLLNEIVDAEAGFGCELSAEKIAETVLTVLKRKDDLSKMRSNARDLASQYSWDSIAKQSHEEYEMIIGK